MKKTSKYISFLLIIAILLFFTNSCMMKVIKAPENRKRLEFLKEKILKYNDSINSFKGEGYAILRNGKDTKTFRVDITFVNNFENYRILIKDFVFKNPLVLLIKEKNDILLYDYIKREKTSFPDITTIFNKILKFNLPQGNIFVKALGMRIPVLENINPKLIDSNSLEYDAGNIKETVYINDELPDKIIYLSKDEKMVIKYDKPLKINERNLPTKIMIKIGDTSLEVNYKKVQINGDYSSEIKIIK